LVLGYRSLKARHRLN
jgi:hypothetical protein